MNLKAILEALLFVSEHPLSLQKMKKVLQDYSGKEIKQALTELQSVYKSPEHGIELVEVAGGYRLQTKPEFRAYILALKQGPPFRLSRAALETLAIIAYRQPITRREIETIKGVDVSTTLKTLLKLNLIKPAGRKEGSTALLYTTTPHFLEVFGLKSLAELPQITDLA